MRAKTVPINDEKYAEYAEWQQPTVFATWREFAVKAGIWVCSVAISAAFWVGGAYAILWFCLHGPKIWNHWIDLLMAGAK